jgi:hypothetical protein
MAKDAGQMHGLHQLMRSWLLAEDPYGMNQMPRVEPTLDTQPRSGRAKAAGTAAVENALAPDPRAAEAGPDAVAQQLFGGQGAPYSESGRNAAYPDVASTQGEAAVGRALAPSPTAEAGRAAAYPDRASTQGESAVDKALNPPMGSGGGFWAPGEAADTASAVGEQAVGQALAKKARGKVAKGRLKDPQDPDDRQPE